ncbi:MAG: MobC family plasmid mobilization relaxosome protein, partial [Lachnospiraceae bacterium]|nr:MobC family plasmid mobilization relaxosome protein [Lachnospiraceae bacterium]
IDYSDLREYNAALGKIGNNLNQIAKRMNATSNVYAADVKQVKELMKQVWDTQKTMLSKQPYMKQ